MDLPKNEIAIASFALVALSFLTKSQLRDDEVALAAMADLHSRVDKSMRLIPFDAKMAVDFARLGEKELEQKIRQLQEQPHPVSHG